MLQRETDKVYVDPALIEYAVRIVTATREPKKYQLPDLQKYIAFGASPRASINLILTACALATVTRSHLCPAAGCFRYGFGRAAAPHGLDVRSVV